MRYKLQPSEIPSYLLIHTRLWLCEVCLHGRFIDWDIWTAWKLSETRALDDDDNNFLQNNTFVYISKAYWTNLERFNDHERCKHKRYTVYIVRGWKHIGMRVIYNELGCHIEAFGTQKRPLWGWTWKSFTLWRPFIYHLPLFDTNSRSFSFKLYLIHVSYASVSIK